MAGYNGKGPMEKGPMTGKGRGFCIIPLKNEFKQQGWQVKNFANRRRHCKLKNFADIYDV